MAIHIMITSSGGKPASMECRMAQALISRVTDDGNCAEYVQVNEQPPQFESAI